MGADADADAGADARIPHLPLGAGINLSRRGKKCIPGGTLHVTRLRYKTVLYTVQQSPGKGKAAVRQNYYCTLYIFYFPTGHLFLFLPIPV